MSRLNNLYLFLNDEKGRTLPRAKLFFYENNSFDFKNTYADKALTSVNPNPVIADGAGRFPNIFLEADTYRVVLQDEDGVEISTKDDVDNLLSDGDNISNTTVTTSTGSQTVAGALDLRSAVYPTLAALEAAGDAGNLTIGRQYGTEVYSSGNFFGANQYILRDGATSRPAEDLGSIRHIAGGSGFLYLEAIFPNGVTPSHFSARGDNTNDDTTPIEQANAYCTANDRDLEFNPGTYIMNRTLKWNPQHYSIRSLGVVVINGINNGDLLAVDIEGDNSSGGRIWYSNATELNGFIFNLAPTIDCFRVGSVTTGHETPSITVRNCLVNDALYGVRFNDDTWVISFERCFFRNSQFHVRFDTVTNAGENMQFDKCTFAGAVNAVIRHEAGSVECTFTGCSFDYNNKTFSLPQTTARGIFRFVSGCHFEDDGSTTQFDIETGTNTYYLEFDHCDWFYTGTIPDKIMDVTTSGNKKTHVTLKNCVIPVSQTSQDRSLSNLFDVGDSVKFSQSDVLFESATNLYFEVISRAASALPDFTTANLGLFTLTNTADVTEIATVPAWSYTATSYLCNDDSGFFPAPASLTYQNRLYISGNIYKTNANFIVQVRFFDSDGNQISAQNLAIPGTLNAWVRFGQTFDPPKGTAKAYVRLNGAGVPVSVGNFARANDWTFIVT